MPQTVLIRPLPDITPDAWDEMAASYSDATVFHLSGWHACLDRSLPGAVIRFEIEANGQVCGHWCGFLMTKFGARVFGAPLPGSATDYMYPLFSNVVPPGDFLNAVDTWARGRRIALVELGGEYFSPADLTAKGYKLRDTQTYRVDLSGGADEVWSHLKPAMRNKVHKAEKSGVVVTQDTSPDFPRRFYDMLQAVFNRQGLTPTYKLERVETIVQTLSKTHNLVTLTAWKDDQALACVLALVDHHTAYFWGGASYETAYPLGANDLIHWHALQLAIERGLTVYDTCGGGDYKTKFGGTFVRLPAGYASMNPLFGVVRTTIQKGFRARSVAVGHARRLGKRD